MKLYATIMNNVSGKTEGVGAREGEELVIRLQSGNKMVYELFYDGKGLLMKAEGQEVIDHELKSQKQKGESFLLHDINCGCDLCIDKN